MKSLLYLLILFLLSSPLLYEQNIKNFHEMHYILAENSNGNDGAHFKYYENDSHIKNWYEWWYFNVKADNKALLLYFFTFGDLNKPMKSKAGVIAAFFIENESIESITSYPFINYSLGYDRLNITIAGNRAYEMDNEYIINYKARGIEINVRMKNRGISFGGIPTKLKGWQWMAWYVGLPYGNASVDVMVRGKQYRFRGMAYHDHNWGIAKPMQLKWDWGEFPCNNFSIIYGIANGIGGLYFVNESAVRRYNISISYEKWVFISGFLKPSLLHIFSQDKKIDLYVEMQKAYIIGIKNFGKPYLLGKMRGVFYGHSIDAIGFYEHHGFL